MIQQRNLEAVRRYRKRRIERAERMTRVDGPLWHMLEARGYTGRKPLTRPNSLGLRYEGP